MGERVVATEQAVDAASQMQRLLDGDVSSAISRLRACGITLSNPAAWDGPMAREFRQTWPQSQRTMEAILVQLRSLQSWALRVNQNIMQAGSRGTVVTVAARPSPSPGPAPPSHPPPPPAHHWWDGAAGFVEDLGKGLWDGVASPVEMLWGLTGQAIYDPKGAGRNWENLGKGLLYGVEHPVEFGKALIDWQDWTTGHPGRAIGELLPTIVVTVLSAGAGAAGKGAEGAAEAERAEQAAADAEKAAAEAKKAADEAAKAAAAEERRLEELARDPAHGNEITPASREEAKIGLDLEKSGKLPGPIRRDPTGAAEFIDADNNEWDIKGFRSDFPPEKGGFAVDKAMASINREFLAGEDVIVNTSAMSSEDVATLRQAIAARVEQDPRWSARKIVWYP